MGYDFHSPFNDLRILFILFTESSLSAQWNTKLALQVWKLTEACLDIDYAALWDTLCVTVSELAKWQRATESHIYIKEKSDKGRCHPLQIYSSKNLYSISVVSTFTYLLSSFHACFWIIYYSLKAGILPSVTVYTLNYNLDHFYCTSWQDLI